VNMDKEESDNIIGTFLYNKLDPMCGQEAAGRITGMFLDLSFSDIFQIATEEEKFAEYYQEALVMIGKEDRGK
jgi:succinate dehydrogenase flavin-adding protein (antitoxin of CptAB toxin-antitoxin module)